uniref:BED-type domain-containing protein n=1 Tax=Cyprinus carpio TaxID=7962 RepID=A0A8C1VDV3_CYPCA
KQIICDKIRGNSKVAFSNWKYRHYFSLIEIKGKSVSVTCTLCPGKKTLSMYASSNSNLINHLTSTHANTTLVAAANPTPNAASFSSSEGDRATLLKQATLNFSGQQQVTKPELNTLIARYVVENMLPLSTVVYESFRAILAKIPIRGGNTFVKFIDSEYEKMNIELKTSFEELEYILTTADIWTAHNKSYLGVTAHWLNPNNMERETAALACRRFKGRCASHTLNLIPCTDVDKWLLSKSATKAVYRSATALWNKTSRSALATETADELVSKKLLVPCTTRWNSFYDALARICEISMVDLNTISSKLGLTAITEREHQFLKEYCTAMKPLTVALDILQGEDCFHGSLICAIKIRFADVLGNKEAIPAAVTLPKFKLHWLRSQELKDKAKASLLAEELTIYSPLKPPLQQKNRWQTILDLQHKTLTLCGFSLIKKISLRYNAATPSSSPVERLFSLGKLVFSLKRNRLSDKRFEKLLLLLTNYFYNVVTE